MSHDTALKLLGLSGGQNKTRAGVGASSQDQNLTLLWPTWWVIFPQVSRTVEDFTEQEVTKAFQGECQTQGKPSNANIVPIHPANNLILVLALRGETGKMRETHEAYQVTCINNLDLHLFIFTSYFHFVSIRSSSKSYAPRTGEFAHICLCLSSRILVFVFLFTFPASSLSLSGSWGGGR